MPEKLLINLNPQQKKAVRYLDGPLLILAGAGSGKTGVLTHKIAYLLESQLYHPSEILAVTFTNKAANEMKSRVEALVNSQVAGMWIGTFHSVCAKILRFEAKHIGYHSNFTIYDSDDQRRQIQSIMEFLKIDKTALSPRQVQYAISNSKNKMQNATDYEKSAFDTKQKKIAEVFWEYETALRRNNAFDFDDLLLKPLDIFTLHKEILEKYRERFKYILVDEYQDTNKAQYHFIKMLSATHRKVCVVGDEDQSIYRWRGADIENILSFESDFPDCKIIRLEQNYRSTQIILNAANSLVSNNLKRLGKKLWSRKDPGNKIRVLTAAHEGDEAAKVLNIIGDIQGSNQHSLNDIAVLYRTNAQSRALEDQLRRSGIPYILVGGVKFYERKEIKDILAYLRVLVNPADSNSLKRIINYPARGIGAISLGHL
ncbi:MAG: ATP-dependent helicase, partial [Calditrichia bacterium]